MPGAAGRRRRGQRCCSRRLALRERGFEITEEASSGEQALAMLAEWVPDIIVLDAHDAGLDGFDTCRRCAHARLRERAGADADRPGRRRLDHRAYEAGATDFFVKSTQWSLLAGRLRYLLRSRAPAWSSSAARASWRARRIWRAWAASTGAGAGGLLLSPEALRVFGFGRRTRGSAPAAAHGAAATTAVAFLRMLRERCATELGAGHRRAR
jgi:DNA-binding response OmpR family regulator